MQADSSVVDSVIFCTKLGIHVDGGNSVVSNVHIYNSGHYDYPTQRALMPFGGIYVHYADGLRILGCYFDDTILVLDNPRDTVVANSAWLIGSWNWYAGVLLRPVQGHGKPRVALPGLELAHNYVRGAPSYNASRLANQRFVRIEEDQGKFNDSLVTDTSVHDMMFVFKLCGEGVSLYCSQPRCPLHTRYSNPPAALICLGWKTTIRA